MPYAPASDIALTDDGDWEVKDGDFALAVGMEVLRDEITIRILTPEWEWFGDPNASAGLDRLIGKRLTRQLVEEGKQRIIRILTYDGLLAPTEFGVYGVPGEPSEITYYIVLYADQESPLEFVLDLNTGVRVVE